MGDFHKYRFECGFVYMVLLFGGILGRDDENLHMIGDRALVN